VPVATGPAATGTVVAEPMLASTVAANTAQPSSSPYRGRVTALAAAAPLVVGLAALLVLGLWIPAGLDAAIRHSVAVLS